MFEELFEQKFRAPIVAICEMQSEQTLRFLILLSDSCILPSNNLSTKSFYRKIHIDRLSEKDHQKVF